MTDRLKYRLMRWLVNKGMVPHRSYSQCGEDLLISFLFERLGISRPSYIDVGAHDPSYLNNTKLFYLRGSRGINVEANPSLIHKFRRHRPRDVNLNVGVVDDSDEGKTLDFYVMSSPTMSTFSKDEAHRLERETSQRIKQVIPLPTRGLSRIVSEHANGTYPDLLSIDIEGLDGLVVPSLAAAEAPRRPKVICIETLTYSESGLPQKKFDLIDALTGLGYGVYADTHINTIFCRSDCLG